MYLHTKNEVCFQAGFQKLRALIRDRLTDRQTRPNALPPAFAGGKQHWTQKGLDWARFNVQLNTTRHGTVSERCTGLSTVDMSYYGSKRPTIIIYNRPQLTAGLNSTQICQTYGGSCVTATNCSTIHLYRQYRHSILGCSATTICCLSTTNFYSLYGHVKTVHILRRRRRRRRRYRKPWRRNW